MKEKTGCKQKSLIGLLLPLDRWRQVSRRRRWSSWRPIFEAGFQIASAKWPNKPSHPFGEGVTAETEKESVMKCFFQSISKYYKTQENIQKSFKASCFSLLSQSQEAWMKY